MNAITQSTSDLLCFSNAASNQIPIRSQSLPELPMVLRERAKRELGETPEVQRATVTELRRAINAECNNLKDVRTDDNYLIKFLRPKKYSVSKTLNLFKNYHRIRQSNPDIFNDLRPETLRYVWESGFVGGLLDRDKEGRRVMLVFPRHWQPQEVGLKDALRSLICQLEYLVDNAETQITGVTMIVDFSKFTFEQARSLRPSYIQLLVNLVQNSFPARFKGVYIVNQSWAFNAVMALFKPFLSEKMKKRISLIGDNLQMLHKIISPEVLPEQLGGHMPAYRGLAWAAEIESWFLQSTLPGPNSIHLPDSPLSLILSDRILSESSSSSEYITMDINADLYKYPDDQCIKKEDEFYDCLEDFKPSSSQTSLCQSDNSDSRDLKEPKICSRVSNVHSCSKLQTTV